MAPTSRRTYKLELHVNSALGGHVDVRVVLTSYARFEDGLPSLTPVCVDIQDFENQIDMLKKDLDSMLEEGRKVLGT